MKLHHTVALSATMLLWAGGTAAAQDVLVEGPGVKVGEATVLHPRLGVEAGVISNVFYEDASETMAGVLRILAALDIAPSDPERLGGGMANGAPTVAFRGGVELEYQEFLSTNSNVQAQRDLDVNAVGDLHFFPASNASFRLQDRFVREARPTNFESSESLTRDYNHFIAELGFHPRGRTLAALLRYENVIDYFESDRSAFANRLQHTIGARGKWKFYPFTQAYIDASLGFYGPLGDGNLDGLTYKNDSNPLRIIGGFDTLFAETLTLNTYIGYANGFYDNGPSYQSVVGGADVGWRYTPTGRVTVGYEYDAKDSINANYYTQHGISASINQTLRDNIVLTGGAGLRFRTYHGVPVQVMPSDENRDDVIVTGNARAAWLLRDRFSLYVEYVGTLLETDFRSGVGDEEDDPSYVRHEAVVGAVAAF